MNPSPFEMSRSVGESLGKGIGQFQEGVREKKDASAIGSILRNAMNSQDPQALNSAMADIMSGISEKGRPAAIKALEGVVDRMDKTRNVQKKSDVNKRFGYDPDIDLLSPEARKDYLRNKSLESYGFKKNDMPIDSITNEDTNNNIPDQNQNIPNQDQNILDQNQNENIIPENKNISNQNEAVVNPPQELNKEVTNQDAWDKLKPEQKAMMAETHPQLVRTFIEQDKLSQKNAIANRKEISESYKENQKFIDSTYDQMEATMRKESILSRMEQLNDTGKLSDSGTINFLKTIGFPESFLKNPTNEEYDKLSLDLLGGGTLQADYGNRILKTEFEIALKRIPTLSQTEEGRRQITANIRAMELPKLLKEKRMQYYLDKAELEGKPLPHNLRGKILNDIRPQLEESAREFKERNGRYKVREGTKATQEAVGKYFQITDGDFEKAKKMMVEDGYTI